MKLPLCVWVLILAARNVVFRIRIKSMVAVNEAIQHLIIFRPTGMFGLGLIAGFAGGFALFFL